MGDLRMSEMLAMQRALWEKNKEKWSPLEPAFARNSLLWMMEELGEVIAIIKKRGEADIMGDGVLRNEFVTELADVLMYYNNILLRYSISPSEISEAYRTKHEKNMGRDFGQEHKNFLS